MPETEVKSESEVKPDTEVNSDTEVKSEAEVKPQTEVKPDTEVNPETKVQSTEQSTVRRGIFLQTKILWVHQQLKLGKVKRFQVGVV